MSSNATLSPTPFAAADTAPSVKRIRPAEGRGSLGLKELWNYKQLGYFFIWRDIKVRYKQPRWARLGRSFSRSLRWSSSACSSAVSPRFPPAAVPNEALCKPTAIGGLHVLPSGPDGAQTARLLSSRRIPELLERAAADFDVILIDSPPMLSVTDARLLSRHADGVVMDPSRVYNPGDGVVGIPTRR